MLLGLEERVSYLHLHTAPQRRVWPQHSQQLPLDAGISKQGLHTTLVGYEGLGSWWVNTLLWAAVAELLWGSLQHWCPDAVSLVWL